MRFKCKLRVNQLETLSAVSAALDRLGPGGGASDRDAVKCVLHLTPGGVRLALDGSSADDVLVFVDLVQAELFAEYKIQSQSDNCILLSLSLANLQRALVSAKASRQAHEWTLKLAKRPHACLILETKAAPGLELDIAHEIPVRLLPIAELAKYEQPRVAEPQVQLEMPARSPKVVVDRLKGIDKYVDVHGDMSGRLVMRVETDGVTIRTHYTDLQASAGVRGAARIIAPRARARAPLSNLLGDLSLSLSLSHTALPLSRARENPRSSPRSTAARREHARGRGRRGDRRAARRRARRRPQAEQRAQLLQRAVRDDRVLHRPREHARPPRHPLAVERGQHDVLHAAHPLGRLSGPGRRVFLFARRSRRAAPPPVSFSCIG